MDLKSSEINLLKLSRQNYFTKELLPEAAIQRLPEKIILSQERHHFEKKSIVFMIKYQAFCLFYLDSHETLSRRHFPWKFAMFQNNYFIQDGTIKKYSEK